MEQHHHPWEALDVDLDDENDSLSQTHSQSILKRCSSRLSQTQTLTFQSQPSKQSSPPPLIPGPAGALQAAMHRRTQHIHTSLLRPQEQQEPLPTQEFIRRVVENPHHHDDHDFATNPWLFALDFLRLQGNGVVARTTLSSIKNGLNTDRVPQVVAVIKSCTSNGLGDMMVILKDPTDTIGASIHHKVLSEGEFGKYISVGAVLVLQKVALFSPSCSSHYLNITLSNLVKVISKDSGPPLKQKHPASPIKHTAPEPDCSKKSWIPQRTFSLSQDRTEGIVNGLRQTSKSRVCAHNDKEMERGNAAPQSGCVGNGNSRNQYAVVEKEPLLVRLGMVTGVTEVASRKDILCSDQGIVMSNEPNPSKQTKGSNPSCNNQASSDAANFVDFTDDQEIDRITGVNEMRQPLISRTSLPQWTDEQLDVLLEFD